MRFGTNIHPYGTSGFYIVFPFHKYTHSVVTLLEFHHQREMTRKKSNEWIERVHGMGFKGGIGVQRVRGWKETHTNFFHSTLNDLVSCGTEFKGGFWSRHNCLMLLTLFKLTTFFGLCTGPSSGHKMCNWGTCTVWIIKKIVWIIKIEYMCLQVTKYIYIYVCNWEDCTVWIIKKIVWIIKIEYMCLQVTKYIYIYVIEKTV